MPNYLIAQDSNNVVGVMPLYLKGHSQGEYIFDHNWAQAFSQAGGHYYPKFQIAVPFTPVSGRRLLLKSGYEKSAADALIFSAKKIAQDNEISSIHITFCAEHEVEHSKKWGLLSRKNLQYHWVNDNYGHFDDFLGFFDQPQILI